MKLKHTFLAAMLLSPLTLAATTSGQMDVSRQESTQRADSAQQNLQQQAGQWGLSADDYQRYQQLMKGPRGTQSPGLDPLSTLGIEAQTPAERRKFAEKWVKEEFARTQKELDFQREVNAAWQRLYPGTLPVNMGNASGVAHDSAQPATRNCLPCWLTTGRWTSIWSTARAVMMRFAAGRGTITFPWKRSASARSRLTTTAAGGCALVTA